MFNTTEKEWHGSLAEILSRAFDEEKTFCSWLCPSRSIHYSSFTCNFLDKRKALNWGHIANTSISMMLVVQIVYFQEGARSCYSEKQSRNNGSKRTGSVIDHRGREIFRDGSANESRWEKQARGRVPRKEQNQAVCLWKTHLQAIPYSRPITSVMKNVK